MSTITTEAGHAVPATSSWLLADDKHARDEMKRVVENLGEEPTPESHKLALLGKIGRAVVEERLVDALREALDDSLADLLVGGWRSHHALLAAARETAGSPGTEEVVKLAQHTVRVSQSPSVDVEVEGVRLATVHAELELAFAVVDAVGVVRDGRLLAVRTMPMKVDADLSVQGVPIAHEHATLDLRGEIVFDPGIRLISEDAE
jgi:hypothetical protein